MMKFFRQILILSATLQCGILSAQADLAGMLIRISEYHKQENYREAIPVCDSAVALYPEIAELYHLRGVTWFYLDEYTRAIEDFNIAVSLRPGFAEAYFFRSKAKARKGNIIGAIRDMNNARNENFYKTVLSVADDLLQSLF